MFEVPKRIIKAAAVDEHVTTRGIGRVPSEKPISRLKKKKKKMVKAKETCRSYMIMMILFPLFFFSRRGHVM